MSSPLNRLRRWVLPLVLVAIAAWLAAVGTQLYRHAQQPVDAVLVLGGSIRREMFIAEAIAEDNSLPVLISHGSQPPCIRLLFERANAPLDQVWLENCAESTFDNYRYSLPILQRWGAQHIQVVTSPGHLPRAAWLAHVMLGSHGMWVEVQTVAEIGVPGNVETPLKTVLDVTRSLGWAILSQVYQPQCSDVMALDSVDLAAWIERGFECEQQAGLEIPEP